jgi:2,3-bisphosphoglycerate-dependent phosphoglycerate mutase
MIYLVRHGQSEWNVLQLTQGQSPHPRLTPLGRRQAAAAAVAIRADLDDRRVAAIVSSDLARAVETAGILADTLAAPVRLDRRLREQALGELEGVGYDQTFAAAASLDLTDPDLRLGGGESAREVSARVADAFAHLDGGGISVVVSHGDTMRSALGLIAGFAPGAAPWVEVPNGGVVVIEGDRPVRWLTAVEPA